MRLIHCSDLHLSSEMESRLSPEKARMRRKELIGSFARLADYAAAKEIAAVLLCGDIFDEGKPRYTDKKNFIDIVRSHPSVDFLCLAGNHDESLTDEDLPKNLLTFGESWRAYTYGEVVIYGVEHSDANYDLIYTTLKTDPAKINIVMLHGQIAQSNVKPSRDNIVLPLLMNKGIDYLALGHIHSYRSGRLDERGTWCYSGCLEGRGFDECGEKGFVLLDCCKDGIDARFVRFAQRTIREYEVDVTGLTGSYEIETRVLSALEGENEQDLVRVYLTGQTDERTEYSVDDLERALSERFFAASVKDRTTRLIDAERFRNELSLRGEFTRTVLAAEGLSEDDRKEILRCGFAALRGEEVRFR